MCGHAFGYLIGELAKLFTGSSASASETTITESTEGEADGDGDQSTPDEVSTTNDTSPTPEAASAPPTPGQDPVLLASAREAMSSPTLNETVMVTSSNTLPSSPSELGCHEHLSNTSSVSPANAHEHSKHPLFSTEQLRIDRRLLLNRKRQLKMYRVWMQAKFRKL